MAAQRPGADPFEIFIRPDGIATMQWIVPSLITLELANAIVAAFDRVSGGLPVRFLLDTEDTRGMDRDARTRLRQATNVLALALIVKSSFSRVLANFFIGFNKPAYPIQLFNTEAEAVAWLRGLPR